MTRIDIQVIGTSITAKANGKLTSGQIGAQAYFSFSPEWSGLNKIAVFRGSGKVKDRALAGSNSTTIPWEVLTQPNTRLEIGVEGRNIDGSIVFPTVWCFADSVAPGANAVADPGIAPTPNVYDDIMAAVGNLPGLKTEAKENLVAAINELYECGGGSADPEAVANLVEQYLKENPPAPGEDGYSPTITTAAITGGTRLTITDKNGTKTVDVMNGAKGDPGADGKAGANGADGYTPVKGKDYYTEADKQEIIAELSKKAVLMEEQSLTDEQKAQTRENIGAVAACGVRTTLKDFGDENDGFGYVAFSGGCLFNGNEVHAVREGQDHYTLAGTSTWGRIAFYVRNNSGAWQKVIPNINWTAYGGELRDPNLSVTRDGKTLLLSCFTTNTDTNTHTNVVFALDENYEATSHCYITSANPNAIIWGNLLQTPDGRLIKAGYTAGESYLRLFITDTAFTGDLSAVTFQEKGCPAKHISSLTEITMGYYGDKLVAIIRTDSTTNTNANSVMVYTSDLTGVSGWCTPINLGYKIHAPALLPYCNDRYLIFSGCWMGWNENFRPPCVGLIDMEKGTVERIECLDTDYIGGGYPSFVRLDHDRFSIVYYKEVNAVTALYHKEVNLKYVFNGDYFTLDSKVTPTPKYELLEKITVGADGTTNLSRTGLMLQGVLVHFYLPAFATSITAQLFAGYNDYGKRVDQTISASNSTRVSNMCITCEKGYWEYWTIGNNTEFSTTRNEKLYADISTAERPYITQFMLNYNGAYPPEGSVIEIYGMSV